MKDTVRRRGKYISIKCVLVILLGATAAHANLFDGSGINIGPVHLDPTNPIAPITPKDAHVPNPAAPLAQAAE